MAAMQSHLYDFGLLKGQCSDVRIRAFGRIYSLHRLFLIQSGFFRAMLCGGFAEDLALSAAVTASASKRNKRRPNSLPKRGVKSSQTNRFHSRHQTRVRASGGQGEGQEEEGEGDDEDGRKDHYHEKEDHGQESHRLDPDYDNDEDEDEEEEDDDDDDILELRFDDPNITRAAFEYCIAHLYGGGPKLVLPYWSSPSARDPLSPAFEIDFSPAPSQASQSVRIIPPNCQPATPRFLLSLLATSIYLNIPSITSQALTLTLCSMTPYTISHYLRFAIGKGIEGAVEAMRHSRMPSSKLPSLWDWELEGPARTLEELGRLDDTPKKQSKKGQRFKAMKFSRGRENDTASSAGKTRGGIEGVDQDDNDDDVRIEARTKNVSTSGTGEAKVKGKSRSRSRSRSRTIGIFDDGEEDLDDRDSVSSPSSCGGKSAAPSSLHQQPSFLSPESTPDLNGAFPSRRGMSAPGSASAATADVERCDPHSQSDHVGEGEEQSINLGQPEFHYGAPADKIGEVCACWIARWGIDLLDAELIADDLRASEMDFLLKEKDKKGSLFNIRSETDTVERLKSGDLDVPNPWNLPRNQMPDVYDLYQAPPLRLWSYPSMPSVWVRALISSDSFFVRSEWERYCFAKRVVEMRRSQKERIEALASILEGEADAESSDEEMTVEGMASDPASPPSLSRFGFGSFGFGQKEIESFGESRTVTASPEKKLGHRLSKLSLSAAKTTTSEEMDEDETEYLELFSSGIYYTHMSFQELKQIGDDVSAVTGRPFVPLNVLQAALWAGSELKNHVLSRSKPKNAFGAGGSYGDRAAFDESTDSQSLEEDLDLGISSPVDDFKKVHDSVAQAGGGRGARSRSGTPFDANVGRSPFPAHQGPDPTVTQSLGGLGTGSLLLGSAGGKAALLERRYYLVPSDDTIRYGEGLQAIHGASTSASSSGHNASSGAQPSAAPDETVAEETIHVQPGEAGVSSSLGATGIATAKQPFTVPVPVPLPAGDLAVASSSSRRDRSNFFGVCNRVATGRDLGQRSVDAADSSPGQPAGRSANGQTQSGSTSGLNLQEGGDGGTTEAEEKHCESPIPRAPVSKWTGYEPMRLGVEFFGVDKLHEKQRLYSPTFFYAGSIWNLYVQTVNKPKGIQLGVYLHRQSQLENLPLPSAPSPPIRIDNDEDAEEGSNAAPGTGAGARSSMQVGGHSGGLRLRPLGGGGFSLGNRRNSSASSDDMIEQDRDSSFYSTSVTNLGNNRGSTIGVGESPSSSSASNVAATIGASQVSGVPVGSGNGGSGSSFLHTLDGSVSSGSHNTVAQIHRAGAAEALAAQASVGATGGGSTSTSTASVPTGGAGASHARSSFTWPHGPTAGINQGNVTMGSTINLPNGQTYTSVQYGGGGHQAAAATSSIAQSAGGVGSPASPLNQHVLPIPVVPLNAGSTHTPYVYSNCPAPLISYRDTRKTLRAYFSIHCPSPLGNALTKFSSGPDQFTISQSWGWKSSSLLGAVYLEEGFIGKGKNEGWDRFRCVCTIGVV